jgi:hypothetical protein
VNGVTLDEYFQGLLVLAPPEDDSIFEEYVDLMMARIYLKLSEENAWEALHSRYAR